MSFIDILLSVAFFSAGLLVLSWTKNTSIKKLPLPPGRKGWPLIGNLLEVPTKLEWKTYHQWAKDLNTDILYVNIAGINVVVLDSLKAATDLLERKSSIYSGRPRLTMVNELMGWNFLFVGMDYGNDWRQHRRLMEQQLHPAATRQFHPQLLKVTRRMLNKFLDDSEYDALEAVRHMIGEIVMSIGYGIEVQSTNDPYITAAKDALHIVTEAGIPGTFLVDIFPFLKHVPEWVPGASFKKKAKEWKKMAIKMIDTPYDATKKNMASGVFEQSFTSINLEKMNEGTNPEVYNERIIRDVAATIYAAGSDTSVAAIGGCILGLLYRPDVVTKAHEELDRVLQSGHLPDFNDQRSLPYITAIVKEALRWRDVAPIGIPHLLKSDDVYRGYRIPAGTMVIGNSWAILHDEKIYPDPFTFNPDRFMKNGELDPSVPDPDIACWGFGRRICPGRHLAYPSVWIAIASLLTVFDIKKAVDADGKIIEPVDEIHSALVSMPMPYRCSITPRSEGARALIRSYKN